MQILVWGCFLVLLFIALGAYTVLRIVPSVVERSCNKLLSSPPYTVREEVEAFHGRLFVADLHADSLLWNRDLTRRYAYGHVDLPRLIEGNVALQVFSVVTKSPKGENFACNRADSDRITRLVVLQAWPPGTWKSLLRRALHQARKLDSFVARSRGGLMLVKDIRDLDELLTRRKTEPRPVGALLALEGVHAMEGELASLDVLYEAGFRMIGLNHFFDNEAGGSAHGLEKSGLTPFGRRLVRCAQDKHLLLDLAHASRRVIDDVLEMTTGPVIVSHTGLCAVCDNERNLSDEHVRRIAESGGVIGITMFVEAVSGDTLKDIARVFLCGADLAGVDGLAVGSDFDGATTVPVDASGMSLLTEAFMEEGFTKEEISKIMGENVLRVLREVLPPSTN